MSKPTVRVLALLELLQSHGQLSGSELARRLEVDGRTLRRYIVALEELGIPISAERGRHGGFSIPSATCGRASPGCRAPTRWKS